MANTATGGSISVPQFSSFPLRSATTNKLGGAVVLLDRGLSPTRKESVREAGGRSGVRFFTSPGISSFRRAGRKKDWRKVIEKMNL